MIAVIYIYIRNWHLINHYYFFCQSNSSIQGPFRFFRACSDLLSLLYGLSPGGTHLALAVQAAPCTEQFMLTFLLD